MPRRGAPTFHRLRMEHTIGGDRPWVGDRDLHCGDGLALQVGGKVLRGRAEYSRRSGWYWTDNETAIDLRPGMLAATP